MMRKIAAIISCGLCLAMSVGQTGLAEQVTLSELRQHIPERLQMTVTTKDGKTIEVDAPIVLPDGATMPIVEVGWLPVNSLAIEEKYALKGSFLTGTGYDADTQDTQGIWINPYNEDFNPQTGNISLMTIPKKEPHRYDAIWKYSLEDYPENNPLAPDRPMAKMQEVLEAAGIADKVDVRLHAQAATFKPLRGRMVREGADIYWDVNEKDGYNGRDMGRYALEFAQYLHEARILGSVYHPVPSSRDPNPKDGDFVRHGIQMEMIAEDDFFIDAAFFRETNIIIEDAMLAPFHEVRAALEARMKAGDLRKIMKLELGYIVRSAEPDVYLPETTRMVLTPTWSILCEDSKNDKLSLSFSRMYTGEAFRYDFYPFSDDNFDLRMDAETAELLLDAGWAWYPREAR